MIAIHKYILLENSSMIIYMFSLPCDAFCVKLVGIV